MARFSVRRLRNGQIEIVGLEAYIARELAKKGARAASVRQRPAKKAVRVTTTAKSRRSSLTSLTRALTKHPRRNQIVKAGKHKDQLFRSLVPLYLARNLGVEVNSGLISRFWKKLGVSYASPNAAKALRLHAGFARSTRAGRQITQNGVKYVEKLLRRGFPV